MAASPWKVYYQAKKFLMDGTIDLDSDSFQLSLYTGDSNASDLTLTMIGEITNEVAAGTGYDTGGKSLTVTWAQGATADKYRFAIDGLLWLASGGNIVGVKYGVIWKLAGTAAERKLLCYSQLDSSQFDVLSGNNLTLTPSIYGVFELV